MTSIEQLDKLTKPTNAHKCLQDMFIYLHSFAGIVTVSKLSEFYPRTGHEGPEEEWMYNCTLSLTSALDTGGWSSLLPAALPPEMSRCPLNRRLGGSQGPSGNVPNISPSPEFHLRTVRPVAGRCTDWADPAQFTSPHDTRLHLRPSARNQICYCNLPAVWEMEQKRKNSVMLIAAFCSNVYWGLTFDRRIKD
jgi:hypothetical protein